MVKYTLSPRVIQRAEPEGFPEAQARIFFHMVHYWKSPYWASSTGPIFFRIAQLETLA